MPHHRKNLELNGVGAEVQNGFHAEKEFDTAVYAPPAYESIDVVRDRLSSLVSAGGAGSEIVLCGSKKSGINRYSQFLSSCGDTESFSRSGNVVVKCEVESEAEGTGVDRSFSASARGQTLEFRTRPGLFSYGELDAGTRTLLEELTVEPGEEVLDLGCGYGAVGCFLSSDTCVSATMSDDDCLAASYASENLGLNGLSGQALVSDAFHGIDQSFDLIASNPPTHAGDGVLRDMLTEAEKQLREGGRIVIVHRKELDLSRFLSGSVSLRQETEGFKVVEAKP
nr:MAG: ribosomal RNA small subunit methyltransferase C [Candidatus Nanosalinarum sp. J07AB56]